MSIYQICALTVSFAALSWILRGAGAKQAAALPLCGGILLLLFAFSRLGEVVALFSGMAGEAGMDEALSALLRMLAVGALTAVAADICRDMGEASLASRVEFCGRVEVLLLCLPFLAELFALARGVLT